MSTRRCPFCRLVLFVIRDVISHLLKQTGRGTKAVGFSGVSHLRVELLALLHGVHDLSGTVQQSASRSLLR
jgi:hypothetical protein